jgi:hypothetical protein
MVVVLVEGVALAEVHAAAVVTTRAVVPRAIASF